MAARLGMFVAASIAAYTVRQINVRLNPSNPATSPTGNEQEDVEHNRAEGLNSSTGVLKVETGMSAKLPDEVKRLQMNRFCDFEELVYLRWINACLRSELRNHPLPSGKISKPSWISNVFKQASKKSSRKQKDDFNFLSRSSSSSSSTSRKQRVAIEPLVQRSSSNTLAITTLDKAKQDRDSLNSVTSSSFQLISKSFEGTLYEKYPSYKDKLPQFEKRLSRGTAAGGGTLDVPSTSSAADPRNNMIGKIQNRSTFLSAVEADVETQRDFVQSLAAQVRAATFANPKELVAFVKSLDEQLLLLVDEAKVLKCFDWPESKAAALREAAFEYQELRKLEKQLTSFKDDPSIPCVEALTKMYTLLEKAEQSVHDDARNMAMSRYRGFGIPFNWLTDAGVVGKMKLSSIQLARTYMKRVNTELDSFEGPENEPNRIYLLLLLVQVTRFAFRVHQFAEGFEAESMEAFEDLRSLVQSHTSKDDENESEDSYNLS